MSEQPGLEYFNQISGRLEIELSEPANPITDNLLNEAASPDAEIVSITLNVEWFDQSTKDARPLTEEELGRVAFLGPSITLEGEGGGRVTHEASHGQSFTVRELVKAIEATERHSRPNSEWFEGIDIHHVFFEGLGEAEAGVWTICWGS